MLLFIQKKKTFDCNRILFFVLRMLSNIAFWEYMTAFLLYLFVLIKPISSQGLACYKCMTTDPTNDACQDPFSSLLNPIHNNCQVDIFPLSTTRKFDCR